LSSLKWCGFHLSPTPTLEALSEPALWGIANNTARGDNWSVYMARDQQHVVDRCLNTPGKN